MEFSFELRKYICKISADKKKQVSLLRSQELLRGETFEEFLQITPKKKSKYIFKAPNGVIFKSPMMMYKYFGCREPKCVLETWCSKGMNGWSKELNSAQD